MSKILDEIIHNLKLLSRGLVGWLIIAPFCALIPRKNNWIAVIGRDSGSFTDNAKYFFLQACEQNKHHLRIVFITEHQDVQKTLSAHGYESLHYPSVRSVIFLARAGFAIVDANDWAYKYRKFILYGSKLIQLWHGVGFILIKRNKWRNEAASKKWLSKPIPRFLRQLKFRVVGKESNFYIVNTTSRFYLENVFRPAFRSKHFLALGYPRNSFGVFDGVSTAPKAWIGVDSFVVENLESWQQARRRIILVTPTFRDTRSTPMLLNEEILRHIDSWCERTNSVMLFKFHTYERGVHQVKGKNIYTCSAVSDFYPIMPYSFCLVTDYSSIYMDYLLTKRPVLFFTPDLDDYLHYDRGVQFDYLSWTPGPKSKDWVSLLEEIDSISHMDLWKCKRDEMVSLAFDDLQQREATGKILDALYKSPESVK